MSTGLDMAETEWCLDQFDNCFNDNDVLRMLLFKDPFNEIYGVSNMAVDGSL